MTTKPELNTEGNLTAGLAAIALFLVLGGVFLTASFSTPIGFPESAAVTKSLGAAMFDIAPAAIMGENQAAVNGESFLIAFETIDVLLVAALVGAVMLARRERDDQNVTVGAPSSEDHPATVAADGGEQPESGGDEE